MTLGGEVMQAARQSIGIVGVLQPLCVWMPYFPHKLALVHAISLCLPAGHHPPHLPLVTYWRDNLPCLGEAFVA